MGLEPNSSSSASASNSCSLSSSASPVAQPAVACSSGKRSRDPEDEVYVDNLNSHKRYLSEVIYSSFNLFPMYLLLILFICVCICVCVKFISFD